ncbi:protein IFH1-like [Lycium ferocissimum]|uniref:protein IFH1-like n=1 Tax=Lycium ferocissimum TaxID=112874 RepID=UPI002815EE56|nr:protein IFH1-like [Lycium ferocissimum]
MSPAKRKVEKSTEGHRDNKKARVQSSLKNLADLAKSIVESANIEERDSQTDNQSSEREEVQSQEAVDTNEQSEEELEAEETADGVDEGDGVDEDDEDDERDSASKNTVHLSTSIAELRTKKRNSVNANLIAESSSRLDIDHNKPSIDEVINVFSIDKYAVRMPLNENNDLIVYLTVKSGMGKNFDMFRLILKK